jgi:hypothetical protein
MPPKNDGDFFTKKHAKLTNVAFIANLFAWIVFVFHIFLVLAKYLETQNLYTYQNTVLGQNPDFIGMLKENLIYSTSFVFNLLEIFLYGIIYSLILKGISLGLYMIVETNLNRIGLLKEVRKQDKILCFDQPRSNMSLKLAGQTACQ